MTLLQRLSPLDIIIRGDVGAAQAAGAGIAAFDALLEVILWANAPGRSLFGLPVDADVGDARALPASLPVTRQIRASARVVAAKGSTRLVLRPGTGIGGRPVTAELKRIDGPEGGIVLLFAEAMRAATAGEGDLAARLLAESGLGDAAIYAADGRPIGESGEELHELVVAEMAALIASDERLLRIETPGRRTTLARVGEGLVLVRHEAAERTDHATGPADSAVNVPMPVGVSAELPAPRAARTGLFSIKRRRLPRGRPAMNMNALVERWHSRQGALPMETTPSRDDADPEGPSQTEAAADGRTATPPGDDRSDEQHLPDKHLPDKHLPDENLDTRGRDGDDLDGESKEDDGRDDASSSDVALSFDGLRDGTSAELGEPSAALAKEASEGPDSIAPGVPSQVPAGWKSGWDEESLTDLPSAYQRVAEPGTRGRTDDPEEGFGAGTAFESDVPEPSRQAVGVPMRSRWSVASHDAPAASSDRTQTAIRPATDMSKPSASPSDDEKDPAAGNELSTVTGSGDPLPAGDAPPPGQSPAIPDDDPALVEGDGAQPVDKETVVILPDVTDDAAAALDAPISGDEEVPFEEAFLAPDEAEPEGLSHPVAPVGHPAPEDEQPEDAPEDGPSETASPSDAEHGEDEEAIEEAGNPSSVLPIRSEPGAEDLDEGPETGVSAAETTGSASEIDTADPRGALPERPATPSAPFAPRFDVPPVRFVWQIDRDGKFRSISAAFAEAVGPAAADVIGRSFRDVAQVFGFDRGGEILRLLDRRDTWSGRSILWPVESSERKVPVDLAALPIYARDRSFDGFRGFGIVRMNEAVEDGEGLGRLLSASFPPDAGSADPAESAPSETGVAEARATKPLLRTFLGESPSVAFGRRAEPPATSEPVLLRDGDEMAQERATNDRTPPPPQVIRLEDRRRPKDGVLSDAEEAAFRAIGMKLGNPSEAESAGGRRFADASKSSLGEAHSNPAGESAAGADDLSMPPSSAAQERLVEASAAVQEHQPISGDVEETGTQAVLDADADGQPVEGAAVSGPELRAIFGSLPIPVLLTARQTLVYANREFEDMTGYDGIAALAARGGIDALFAEPDDGLESGEIAILRSNGQRLDVRVQMQRITLASRSHLLMSFSPSPRESAAAAGAVTAVAGVPAAAAGVRDIVAPALQEAEPPAAMEPGSCESRPIEDLRQEVEELQTVLDTATDGIVLLDPAGMIRSMNGSAHALFGIAQDDHQGRHLSSLFAHESQKATVDYLEMLRDNGLAGILNDGREVIGRVAQGGFIPLFITIGRLSGERGWCVVIRDIAHWKRIEEDLVNARRQAEAASLHKSRFLANISHELRTPLNAIIGFADVMASECFGPIGNERYLEYLGDIKRSGHHVLDLVNDLLDISKIESGKLDLDFEAVSLNEVVQEVVSLMQPQANRERVIVRSNLPSTVPPVVADRRTMRQIALNLVANAIRFTPAGGQIIASTTYTAEGDVLMRFRDSGIGMTEREIEIALTPFQQVHAPSVTRGEGTGLGLPLTKAMVEANRAIFAIQSAPGEGTLVEISFPPQRVLAD